MSPNPIHKVLSSIQEHKVRSLLMGGQACVFYGAAEFSRDIDIALLINQLNLGRFRALLRELQAEVIAVPSFELDYLRRGHAVHFRCMHPDTGGIRLDVMANMRGVDEFSKLWRRRTTIESPDGAIYELMAINDLVKAKKTQRDKDWPMIRRLVEADYFANRNALSDAKVRFWMEELRTAELLVSVAKEWPNSAARVAKHRPLVRFAQVADVSGLEWALIEEERMERERDRIYWAPLRKELFELMHRRNAREG